MRVRTIIALFLALACDQNVSQEQTANLDQETSKFLVETITYDFDNDGEVDTILLTNPPVVGDPGDFGTIEIEHSNGLIFKYESKDVWDSVDTYATRGLTNTLKSKRVFGLKQGGQNFLLLFGIQYSCCIKRLTIIALHDNKPSTVFDQEFEVSEITDLDSNGTFELIGRDRFIEMYGEVDSSGAEIGTYAPYKVFSLTTEPTFQEDLSKKYNEENYVYAGPEYLKDIEIAYPKEGQDFKPFVVNK